MDDDVYYSTVYSWFDKNGIISNVRTHLRQNLVNALKKKDASLKQSPKFAKQYVFDLLIAEYLHHHNYAYTLSVLTSETCLPVNFHESSKSEGPKIEEKLRNDYVQHALETLGIRPQKGRYIMAEYAKKDVSLLVCILQCLSFFVDDGREKSEKLVFKNEETQTRFDCKKCENISGIKSDLARQKEEFEGELRGKESLLKQQALIVEQQIVLLQEKMKQAETLMIAMNEKSHQISEQTEKENERIEQKWRELKLREEFITKETIRLENERKNYEYLEENLRKVQDELAMMRNDISKPENHFKKDIESQTDFSRVVNSNLENGVVEKPDLREKVQEQQERINQLNLRTIQLSQKFKEMGTVQSSVQVPVRFSTSSVVLSENSSTEDILQDARMRLKKLEEESLKAEKHYQNFLSTPLV